MTDTPVTEPIPATAKIEKARPAPKAVSKKLAQTAPKVPPVTKPARAAAKTAAPQDVVLQDKAPQDKASTPRAKAVTPRAKAVAPAESKAVTPAESKAEKKPVKMEIESKEKPRKAKLVRDSFTMPEEEYAVLGEVKKACLKAGMDVKKSELLRVGVMLLKQLDAARLKEILADLPTLKAGRPKKSK